MSAVQRNSTGKDGFLFLGNQLALDLINTRPLQNGELVELLPDFGALLRWFRAVGLLSSREVASLQRRWGHSARAQRTVEAVWRLREKLRKQVLSWEGAGSVERSTINELNRLMAQHPMHTRLKSNGGRSLTELYFEPREPEDLFAPLGYSAAMLFANLDRNRVRKCEHCVLHFYDGSKKGNRRWCSMQLCGNRVKVAAYADRHRRQSNK